MPLRFLFDENQRGLLWQAMLRHNNRGMYPLDVVRVGDLVDLPLGVDDPTILSWCEREQRLLVSVDKGTLPAHLANHLAIGGHSPGILIPLAGCKIPDVLDFLVLAAYASSQAEWMEAIRFIP